VRRCLSQTGYETLRLGGKRTKGRPVPRTTKGDCFSQRACNDANAAAKRPLRKDRTLTFVV
jgi:hypothetical protein